MRQIIWSPFSNLCLDELLEYGYRYFGAELTDAYYMGVIEEVEAIALSEIMDYGRPCTLKSDHDHAHAFLYHLYRKHVIIFSSDADSIEIIAIFRAERSWDKMLSAISTAT